MAKAKKGMTFTEAIVVNEKAIKGDVSNFKGMQQGFVSPVVSQWQSLLSDLAINLYTWQDKNEVVDIEELLLIENYLFYKRDFALVRTKYKRGNNFIYGKYRILPCAVISRGLRNNPLKINILLEGDVRPKNLVMTYSEKDFVYFKNDTTTMPSRLAANYAYILQKLDNLYEQNVNKLGLPIISLTDKSIHNNLIGIYQRAEVNAVYGLVQDSFNKKNIDELFYSPNVPFILDKIYEQREAIMREYLQELGVNPNGDLAINSQYVNTTAIRESSLISKFFSASLNLYKTHFCKEVAKKFSNIDLDYYTTVKTNLEVGEGSTIIDETIRDVH